MSNLINRIFIFIEVCLSIIISPFFKRKNIPKWNKILIFGYGGIGDALLILPILKAIKTIYPNSKTCLITSKASKAYEIFKIAGCPDEVIFFEYNRVNLFIRWKFNFQLINQKFDLCFSNPFSPIQYFIPTMISIPVRVGAYMRWQNWWRPRQNSLFNYLYKDKNIFRIHETERYFKLLEILRIDTKPFNRTFKLTISSSFIQKSKEYLYSLGINEDDIIIGLHLSTSPFMLWKQWKFENMLELTKRLTQQFDAKILLFGSESEEDDLKQVAKVIGNNSFVICPKDIDNFSAIEISASFIKSCTVFIGNDSGPGLISIAVDTPTIRIWGMTDYWGVRAIENKHHDIWKNLPCSPCFQMGFVISKYNLHNCKHHNCLNTITVEEVFEVVSFAIKEIKKIST